MNKVKLMNCLKMLRKWCFKNPKPCACCWRSCCCFRCCRRRTRRTPSTPYASPSYRRRYWAPLQFRYPDKNRETRFNPDQSVLSLPDSAKLTTSSSLSYFRRIRGGLGQSDPYFAFSPKAPSWWYPTWRAGNSGSNCRHCARSWLVITLHHCTATSQ